MKKAFSIVLSLAVFFALAACGNMAGEQKGVSDLGTVYSEKIRILHMDWEQRGCPKCSKV